jgi:hypothetical protein
MIKGATLNTRHGSVKIKSTSQVLNSMRRDALLAYKNKDTHQLMMILHDSLSSVIYPCDKIDDQDVIYFNKIHKIYKPRDFKEMKKDFIEYLLTPKEITFTDQNGKDYNITIGDDVVRVKLENLLQGVEDAAGKLMIEYYMNSYYSLVLFPLKPRIWCLLAEDAWSMMYVVKSGELRLLGISPIPHKLKSWVIIEVERTSVSSNPSPNVRKSYD